jgi:hypothetical protein
MSIESELAHLATKEQVAELKAEMHKELHALTWRFVGLLSALLSAQTALILGGIYFMLSHWKP